MSEVSPVLQTALKISIKYMHHSQMTRIRSKDNMCQPHADKPQLELVETMTSRTEGLSMMQLALKIRIKYMKMLQGE